MKANDLRQMSDEQLDLTLKDTVKNLFHLRFQSATDRLEIDLQPTTDVLATLSARRRNQVLVGFAAEHGAAGLERARQKRTRKRVDLIVHNDVSEPGIGFEGDDNAVTIVGADGEIHVSRTSKRECAERILDVATPLLRPPG